MMNDAYVPLSDIVEIYAGLLAERDATIAQMRADIDSLEKQLGAASDYIGGVESEQKELDGARLHIGEAINWFSQIFKTDEWPAKDDHWQFGIAASQPAVRALRTELYAVRDCLEDQDDEHVTDEP